MVIGLLMVFGMEFLGSHLAVEVNGVDEGNEVGGYDLNWVFVDRESFVDIILFASDVKHLSFRCMSETGCISFRVINK